MSRRRDIATGRGLAAAVLAAIVATAVLAGCVVVRSDGEGGGNGGDLADGSASTVDTRPIIGLRVVGDELIGLDGEPVRLVGVNRAGAEFACTQGLGVWDGAADAAVVDAIVSWGVNAVRVPVNEQCWLGVNGFDGPFGGEAYRASVTDFVRQLRDRGLVVVLGLMWTAPGDALATSQERMASADHAVAFWTSAAAHFAGEPLMIFDLYGEPHGIDWTCWRDGCTFDDGYRASGMQQLLDAVRSTGATQPVVVSGIRWANDLSQWLEYRPKDPLDNVIAGFHLYDFNACVDPSCWDREVATVAAEVPVLTAELGQSGCRGEFVRSFAEWAAIERVGFLAWTFNPWNCDAGPALVSDHAGTPTPYGAVVRELIAGSSVRLADGRPAPSTGPPPDGGAASSPPSSAPCPSEPVASEPVASEPVASEPAAAGARP